MNRLGIIAVAVALLGCTTQPAPTGPGTATLQVGANIYTDGVPDVVARFENLKIEPIPGGAGC